MPKPSQPIKDPVAQGVPIKPVPAPQVPLTEQERLQACGAAINQALADYGCELRAVSNLAVEGINVVVAHPVVQLAIKVERATG